MANSILTPSIIAKEALVELENELVFAQQVHRDYSDEFVKVGDTITIRKPVRYTVTDGATMVTQDTEEGSTTLTIDRRKHVALNFSMQDMTLKIEEFSKRYIKPAIYELAQYIDSDLAALATKLPTWVGTPGSALSGVSSFLRGPQRMDELAMPKERTAILCPADYYGMVSDLKTVYVSDKAKTAIERAKIGPVANVDSYQSNSVVTFTTGARGGSPQVNGAGQTSTWTNVKANNSQSLVVKGASNSITGWAKAGDVFTIAGVYEVNPRTRAPLPYLKQFVVTADANSNGSGAVTLTIAPAIITSGPYQNASAAPADSANLTFMGAASTGYTQSVMFTKQTFALVMRPLQFLPGITEQARESYKGLSIRLTPVADGVNDIGRWRLDVLYGVKCLYPETGLRISG